VATLLLTTGVHTLKWTLSGYQPLEATISISSTGVITCLSITGGNCGSNTPPNLTISGNTITGNLLQSSSTATICTYIESSGGPAGLSIPEINTLVDAYIGFVNLGFTPTIPHILGAVDYMNGFIASGNSKTGCNY